MTVTHRYTAADDGWLAFIAPARQLFVRAELDAAAVEQLWTRLRDERGPAGILEALAERGLFATPPFAFVEADDDGVTAIVRGDAVVHAGEERVSGAGAATWIERRLPAGPVGVVLTGSGSTELPIEAGVVRAAAFATGGAIAPVAVPAPSEPVEPEPVEPVELEPVPAPEPAAAVEPEAPEESTEVSEETVIIVDDEAPVAASAPDPAPAPEPEGYDYLFGDTMYRSVQDAAVPVADAEEPEGDPDPAAPGDHDGSTVLATSIPRGRNRRARGGQAAPAAPSVVVVLPDGTREVLEGALVLGRSPSVSGVPAGQLPRLVTISGGDQDISRSHVRIALEGGTVVVTDLHSRNGTSLVLPGGETQKLRAGEPTPIMTGTTIDLGGGTRLTVEEV